MQCDFDTRRKLKQSMEKRHNDGHSQMRQASQGKLSIVIAGLLTFFFIYQLVLHV